MQMKVGQIIEKIQTQAKAIGADNFPLAHVLAHVLENKPFNVSDLILEFGVGKGTTIRMIANALPKAKVWGFDSFKGLPETWNDGATLFPVGAFSTNGVLPSVPSNVELVPGLFSETLHVYKERVFKDAPIGLLHIDCDIYSSTKLVFDTLRSNIVDGTVIVFDELWSYPGCVEHELKAFSEYLTETGRSFEAYAVRENYPEMLHGKEVAVVIREGA